MFFLNIKSQFFILLVYKDFIPLSCTVSKCLFVNFSIPGDSLQITILGSNSLWSVSQHFPLAFDLIYFLVASLSICCPGSHVNHPTKILLTIGVDCISGKYFCLSWMLKKLTLSSSLRNPLFILLPIKNWWPPQLV